MPHSSCLCGAIHVSFTGEPLAKASHTLAPNHTLSTSNCLLYLLIFPPLQFMCSCLDDRKITGSLFGATNLMIPTEGLETTQGALHTFTKVVESGAEMTSHLCANCGSTLYRSSTQYLGVVMMKAGCIDDGFDVEDGKPAIELFSRSHVKWVPEVEGVQHNHAGL